MGFNERLLLTRRDELDGKGVRDRLIGRKGWRVPKRVQRHIDDTEAMTAGNRRMNLTFTFNYGGGAEIRSEEHTSELQSLMRISYDVFSLKKNKTNTHG